MTATATTGLRRFQRAGVLSEGDLALLQTLIGGLAHDLPSRDVRLALALALRAPRTGNVCVHLPTVAVDVVPDVTQPDTPEAADTDADGPETDGPDADAINPGELVWPEPQAWRAQIASCPLVRVIGDDAPETVLKPPRRPFVLDGTRLYLTRLWHEEISVARQLRALAAEDRLSIITGGPGTGKTTRIAEQLVEQLRADSGERPSDTDKAQERAAVPPIALAAPTGKAASRVKESLDAALQRTNADSTLIERVRAVPATTLHRLLRLQPGRIDRTSRAHGPDRPLPASYVIVDEVSMVSLPLLAQLLSALPSEAHLTLVGDPDQLASVEAGSVLADLVTSGAAQGGWLTPALTHQTQSWRFDATSGIGRLASAVRDGQADDVMALLRDASSDEGSDLIWINPKSAASAPLMASLQQRLLARAKAIAEAARNRDADLALNLTMSARVLCAHRLGPMSVEHWNRMIDEGLGDLAQDLWYAGRPVLVTRNDATIGVMNGDLGVVVQGSEGRSVAFDAGPDAPRHLLPVRLPPVETVHAMTIHKSQGSEFDHVDVMLPSHDAAIVTRELLYTAMTRARKSLTIVATEDTLRRATQRRAARSSGLAERLV